MKLKFLATPAIASLTAFVGRQLNADAEQLAVAAAKAQFGRAEQAIDDEASDVAISALLCKPDRQF